MDIKDVAYIGIVGSSSNVLFSYNYGNIDENSLLHAVNEDDGPILLLKENTVFVSRLNDITLILVSLQDSNEIFVSQAFQALEDSLTKVIKNWCTERIFEKYDQIELIVHEFVFKGIIMTDNSDELSSRVMKRTFENLSSLKVNKGFASFINKAVKKLGK